MNEHFHRFARGMSNLMGSPFAFFAAVLVIVAWAVTEPLFNFSVPWQVVSMGTTIGTFLMMFLLQNTQNRDAKAIHLKLDELVRGVHGARTGLVNLEELSDADLDRLQQEFQQLRCRNGRELKTDEAGPAARSQDASRMSI